MKYLTHLINKLECLAPLPEQEKSALLSATSPPRRYEAHIDLMQEGAPPDGVRIILDGLACRYKVLPDGRRQILAYFLAGDMCDARVFLMQGMEHSIGTLSPVEASVLPQEALLELTDRYPRLARAFWWSTLVEEAIAREWIVNVGHRTAFERMAHLFCELFERLRFLGLTQENRCELPLTQTDLADTLALSAVHVNRTLMDMRRARLVTFHARQLIIHDYPALQSVAGFDPAYLHLDTERNRSSAARPGNPLVERGRIQH